MDLQELEQLVQVFDVQSLEQLQGQAEVQEELGL